MNEYQVGQDFKKVQLTAKEKSELFAEGIITVILLLLLNLSIMVLLQQAIVNNPQLRGGVWMIKNAIAIGPNGWHIWSWQNWFVILMGIADVLVVYWRLIRRYHQMQMWHVIGELHYIADGHLEHRINLRVNRDLQRVIDSVNTLVDSTVRSMEEERKIEKSKDELITNVSHDLRTPLTSIIGYLGLIEDNQYQTKDELTKYTHTAYVKAQQMKVLVEDLFEYTKVRQTSTPIAKTTFDMEQMLEQLAASFELEAQKKNMQIMVECQPAPLMMEADTEKLGRVFNNLIANALKYGKGGKQIILSAEKVGQEAIIKVSNDGQQIPSDSLNQLFDRFYRVEASRSQETGGTGLGLAITQSIVALHGGYIYADSTPELTSFVIHLPLKLGRQIEPQNGAAKNS
ncbi:sensor histidine kinase [Latilactobacillus sakei]|jgi:signal transduction histidine kinase|uniref:histidine kinase n=1 Tax=Latilactobacillus sakei TaxID=1599 RepID=A0A9N7IZ30_LATSK|nr:HAMP domain-containing sensor histidine kinase [Latilactobacillus sakei]ARJ72309.1 two-component sensor histidine kinase [Latilactobacillus sakei]AST84673.1 sensor histidine kinase [Latilactobacillus sakei]AWZ42624.1 sensor histidine kinase [Latilactobacillus sakei]AWZ43589.1 sensor histidine kinase [Latilactobacillus sakei]AWZ46200.1 sensor histidine kinase [Latilactobacillus sakei]